MQRYNRFILGLIVAMLPLGLIACDQGPDANSGEDKDRGGALQVGIGQVVTDDLNPDAGDSTDWKSFAVPAPGFLTVQVFWDQSDQIKNAQISVHDKFGAQLEARKHQASIPQDEVVVRVEEGYYFVKLQAERGSSIYSIVGRHEIGTNSTPGGGGGVRPQFGSAISVGGGGEGGGTEDGGSGGGGGGGGAVAAGGGGGGGGAAGGGSGGGGGEAAGGGGALPQPAGGGAAAAGGGGVALPVAAGGGAAGPAPAPAPTAPAPTPVAVPISAKDAGGGGKAPSAAPAPTNLGGSGKKKDPPKKSAPAAIKPIASDISGPYREYEAPLSLVTPLSKGAKIKLRAGERSGIQEGFVGEIYVDGQMLKGGRFKITKVNKSSCYAKTNADADTVKKASKLIIKIPE